MCAQKASACGVRRGLGRREGGSPRRASRMSWMFMPGVRRSTVSSMTSKTALRNPFSLTSSKKDGTGNTDMAISSIPHSTTAVRAAGHTCNLFCVFYYPALTRIRQGYVVVIVGSLLRRPGRLAQDFGAGIDGNRRRAGDDDWPAIGVGLVGATRNRHRDDKAIQVALGRAFAHAL